MKDPTKVGSMKGVVKYRVPPTRPLLGNQPLGRNATRFGAEFSSTSPHASAFTLQLRIWSAPLNVRPLSSWRRFGLRRSRIHRPMSSVRSHDAASFLRDLPADYLWSLLSANHGSIW